MPSDPKAPETPSSPPRRVAGSQLFVFLPTALHKALCERAEVEETTLAAVMRQALHAWLGQGRAS